MHALTAAEGTKYNIFFGGSYEEHWSEDYTLFVSYSGRKHVEARLTGGEWIPAGGDTALCAAIVSSPRGSMIRRYFTTAAEVYAASQDCLHRGIPLTRLYELFSFSDPIAAPELLRLLMDDCGFKLEMALGVAARCCPPDDLNASEINALAALQPRTAYVSTVLEKAKDEVLAVEHDGSRAEYRDPPRALRCGDRAVLSFRLLCGRVDRAVLRLYGDDFSEEYEMNRRGDDYSVAFTAPDKAAALWYSFRLETPQGLKWICPDETLCCGELCDVEREGFRFTVYLRDFTSPEWFGSAIMYQIFPDRFAFSNDGTAERGIEYHRALGRKSELHASLDEPIRWQPREFEDAYEPDDFYGGTFRGIERKLPYLKELGVSCIYLNPIAEARSNHRYDTADYLNPDPILGTLEDFESLARAADASGIRIILDGVFSHTGADSVYFNRYGSYPTPGACQGEDSEYYSWYDFRHFPDDYRCWWGFRELPEVNELDPAWQKKIITSADGVVRTWLRRGASGWRLDVADELPDEALSLIREAARAEKADAPIIGEVWEDAIVKESYGGRRNYALGYSLDSVMNYPLRAAVLDFAHFRSDARALRDFLKAQRMNYPEPMYYCLMNLLGSHDVERLKSNLATDVVIKSLPREQQLRIPFTPESLERAERLEKICSELQFVLPGVPSIYYGDEQGMEGVGDPFNRAPFTETGSDLHGHYARLCAMRRSDPVFARGEAAFFAPSADILAVVRFDREDDNGGAYLSLINRGAEAEVRVDLGFLGLGEYRGHIGECAAKTEKLR